MNISIIGAGGLSGLELIHYLQKHPNVRIQTITSDKYAGQKLSALFPQFHQSELVFEKHDVALEGCDIVFLAVPNRASLEKVPSLLKQGLRVIDLSGVYRLEDTVAFEKYYGMPHTSPELLKECVFGLSEVFTEAIKKAQLIANPGCYPTGALLGLLPFGELLSDLDRPPIIDAKSGVTGAGGRVEDDTTNYISVNENLKAYKAFKHQHQPEIQQYGEQLTGYDRSQHGDVIFTPYLLPLNRGILSTIYLHFKQPYTPDAVHQRFAKWIEPHPFLQLLPEGQLPDLKMVQHSNRCAIGLACDESHTNWIVVTAIDNLVKGAAGQAIQNMNLMLGLDQTTGLL